MDLQDDNIVQEIVLEDSDNKSAADNKYFNFVETPKRALKRWSEIEKEELVSLVDSSQIQLNVTGRLQKGDKNKYKEGKKSLL